MRDEGAIFLLGGILLVGGFLYASIMLVRRVRNGATVCLLTGSALMLITAPLVYTLALAGSAASYVLTFYLIVMALFGVGALLVFFGFLGVCAQFGATAERARELEGLLATMQERMNQGGEKH